MAPRAPRATAPTVPPTEPLDAAVALSLGWSDVKGLTADQLPSIAELLAAQSAQAAKERERIALAKKQAAALAAFGELTPEQVAELDRLRDCSRRRGQADPWQGYRASRAIDRHHKGPGFRAFDKHAVQISCAFDPYGITGKTEIDNTHRAFAQLACALLAQKGRLSFGEILTLTAYIKGNFMNQAEIIDAVAASMPGWRFRWSAEPGLEIDPEQGTPAAWPGAVAFAVTGAALIAQGKASGAQDGQDAQDGAQDGQDGQDAQQL